MGVVDAHQRRQQQFFRVLEVVVENVADVFRRKPHQSEYTAVTYGPQMQRQRKNTENHACARGQSLTGSLDRGRRLKLLTRARWFSVRLSVTSASRWPVRSDGDAVALAQDVQVMLEVPGDDEGEPRTLSVQLLITPRRASAAASSERTSVSVDARTAASSLTRSSSERWAALEWSAKTFSSNPGSGVSSPRAMRSSRYDSTRSRIRHVSDDGGHGPLALRVAIGGLFGGQTPEGVDQRPLSLEHSMASRSPATAAM